MLKRAFRRKKDMEKRVKELRQADGLCVENIETVSGRVGRAERRLDVYGETRVILLPVGPYLIYVSWNVTIDDLKKVKHSLDKQAVQSSACLRFYDVTDTMHEITPAKSTFDILIDLYAKNWYVNLLCPDKRYFVELGFKTDGGRFFPIARSNTTEVPPDGFAGAVDHQPQAEGNSDGSFRQCSSPLKKIRIDKPPEAANIMQEEPAEIDPSRIMPESVSSHSTQLTKVVCLPVKDVKHIDLTEINEMQFTCGLSSVLFM